MNTQTFQDRSNSKLMPAPKELYRLDVENGVLLPDEAQAKAVDYLQSIYEDLTVADDVKDSWLSGLSSLFSKSQPVDPVRGVYFWGGVGRGKTYLIDLFFDSLPFEQKLRLHFHRFMQRVHLELTDLQGKSDPLRLVAERLAAEAKVICLDEFFVKDITDAMLLAVLLDELFKRGVVLVTTSNIVPSGLYKDGLQRARFLPAIDLLERYTHVVNVDGGVDYRLRVLQQAELYYFPNTVEVGESLAQRFEQLIALPAEYETSIDVLGRDMVVKACADDVIWFDFLVLCDGPRSQNDYIELAKIYHAVVISDVPVMGVTNDDQARRFINLVDEFYDRSVKLIISAEVSIAELYTGGKLDFEFERTESRLLEMQSKEYLAREHRA